MALAKGLRRAPDPPNFRGSTSTTLFFSLLFSMFLFDSNLLRFSTQHDPILDPMLALISPSFALLFPITFPIRFPTSFWIDFGPQINLKINPKSIKDFFQNPPTNKSYFSFIFNQILKTISCSSKMVDFRKSCQNLMFLQVFYISDHANQSKHATCNALKNHQKPCQKINYFSIDFQLIFDHFWHRFPSPKFKHLGEGLGLDFGLDFRPCWGPKRRPNGIKNSSRKKMPT